MANGNGSGEARHALLELDRLVHEPARHLVLDILSSVDEADFIFLLHNSGLTRGNLSAHLAKLEDAGYVAVKKTFAGKVPRTLLSLTANGRKAVEGYRKAMMMFLVSR